MKINFLCELLGKSKQAYYKLHNNSLLKERVKKQVAVDFVNELRIKDPKIGLVKAWVMHREKFDEDLQFGRDKFIRLMADEGLRIRNRSYKPRTTNSRHGLPKYPNLIREFIPNKINQLWVSDITYLRSISADGTDEFYYLSLITDAYSHEIVGWSLNRTLAQSGPINALKMALRGYKEGLNGLIHHSDRGCQYCSTKYVTLLISHGINISMTESGDPKENAVAERVNGIIKNELLGGGTVGDFESTKKKLAEVIAFYNEERPHLSNNLLTPKQAAQSSGMLKKGWRSYREEYIKNNSSAA